MPKLLCSGMCRLLKQNVPSLSIILMPGREVSRASWADENYG